MENFDKTKAREITLARYPNYLPKKEKTLINYRLRKLVISYDSLKMSKWRLNNPDKSKAHRLVFISLRNGTITKKCCVVCGESKSEAHHKNYKKPLDITWLCKRHHAEADKVRREKELLTV